MHIASDDLIAILRAEGLRITEPRRLVCEVIAKQHAEHLTAAGIFEAVNKGIDGGVDRATVYRILDVLEEAGAIKHGHIGHGATVYHLTEESAHQHLVCSNCEKVVTLDDGVIAPLVDGVASATGFHIDIEHIALTGICDDCA